VQRGIPVPQGEFCCRLTRKVRTWRLQLRMSSRPGTGTGCLVSQAECGSLQKGQHDRGQSVCEGVAVQGKAAGEGMNSRRLPATHPAKNDPNAYRTDGGSRSWEGPPPGLLTKKISSFLS